MLSGNLATELNRVLWLWPVPVFLLLGGIATSFAFGFPQIRYFFTSLGYVLFPKKADGEVGQTLSPIQAFFSALGAVLGNGSLVGMAGAMYTGGPGGAIWLLIFGLVAMPIRFAEVFVSSIFTVETEHGRRGGPMVYLARVPGGRFLPHVFSFLCLVYCLVSASMMQSNAMGAGITHITGLSSWIVAAIIFGFLLYIMLGGAQRVIRFAEAIAPVKVILFLLVTSIVIIYFLPNLLLSLKLMVTSACSTKALMGGLAGHCMQTAMRAGIGRAINAGEVGLGTSSVMFGATGGKDPVRSSIMSMALVVTIELVCFFIMLAFTVSGTWNSGADAMPLVIATYSTVFGWLGAWVATAISVLFGVGTLVGYGFIGRECWLFLSKGKAEWLFILLYVIMAPLGVMLSAGLVWNLVDLVVDALLFCNLYGVFYLIPQMRRKWREYGKTQPS
ncbi:MAG: alanine:cation symporter family protein [Candidatus Dependentiae bacterium]|nr:alanine:cation symporter family protein [Candidatus Dependentiae bacterium]